MPTTFVINTSKLAVVHNIMKEGQMSQFSNINFAENSMFSNIGENCNESRISDHLEN